MKILETKPKKDEKKKTKTQWESLKVPELLELIRKAEGTQKKDLLSTYNTLYNNGKSVDPKNMPEFAMLEFTKPLTEMTVGEIIEKQKDFSQRRDATKKAKELNRVEENRKITQFNNALKQKNKNNVSSDWQSQLKPLVPKPNYGIPSHAVGAYQMMANTLEHLINTKKAKEDELFVPEVQDRLAVALMEERGYNDFLEGKKSDKDFMYDLSKVWASLPVPKEKRTSSGKMVTKDKIAYYDSHNQHKARIDNSEMLNALNKILYDYQTENNINPTYETYTDYLNSQNQNKKEDPKQITKIQDKTFGNTLNKSISNLPNKLLNDVPSKQFGFGGFLKNIGVHIADDVMSVVGASTVADDWYTDDKMGKSFKKIGDVTGKIGQTMGTAAVSMVGGPMAGAALGAVQNQVGKATNKQKEVSNQPLDNMPAVLGDPNLQIENPNASLKGNPNFAYGGNRSTKTFGGMESILHPKLLKGPTHERGGINIGRNQEAEGGEVIWNDFIFSNRF